MITLLGLVRRGGLVPKFQNKKMSDLGSSSGSLFIFLRQGTLTLPFLALIFQFCLEIQVQIFSLSLTLFIYLFTYFLKSLALLLFI